MLFKADDVITYRFQDNVCEAIVHRRQRVPESVTIRAVRSATYHPEWHDYTPKGARLPLQDGDVFDLRLHPDADEVWASYVAHVLTTGAA